ncbi:citrate lyase holo-[acyl-carrier protein] synthase [Mycoplasmatota bacterium]|nr:citrate lyase holo-[acyl-carrier protein] synthase [Mycoplasmatota bacterium]
MRCLMILEAREKRFNLQKELVSEFNMPLVVFRINYPGSKNNYIVNTIYNLIDLDWDFEHKVEINDKEGLVLLGIVDLDSSELKKRMINIEENHPLGRLLDIDVYDESFKQLSRTDLGYSQRKCLICDDIAHYCIRSEKHSLYEVQQRIYHMFVEYLSSYISDIACESLHEELNLLNKPGLVTPNSNGAHKDMDYMLMLKSIASLRDGFRKIVKGSFTLDLSECKQIGKSMEEEMFKATNGVNTHKGGIFIIGALIISFVKSLKNSIDWQDNIRYLFKDISKELLERKYHSHGKDVYLKYGITGVRGEAEKGFPLIFKNLEGDNLKVLFRIMSDCDDTTILYRHNLDVLEKVKYDASDMLDLDISKIKKLDKEYSLKGISPGGSADLLGGVIFVRRLISLLN